MLRLRIFLFFAFGYFVSFLFRGVNIAFAPFITRDLGLGAGDLGFLTSLYFLGFAAAQIPAGVLLDRYGARRTVAALMVVAAIGILIFGMAGGLHGMMIGRLLIGVGVSVCFGGACKAFARHFPAARLPLLYSLLVTVGGLGGVLIGTPFAWMLGFVSWRGLCAGLAGLTILAAGLVMVGTPETPEADRHTRFADQLRGTLAIFRWRFFWRVVPFSAVTQGVFYATQSLWVGAYMRDVSRLDPTRAAFLVSVLGLALMAGTLIFGVAARTLERRGLSVIAFSGLGMALFVVDQILIIAEAPLPAAVLWIAYGFFGGVGVLTYAVLADVTPASLVGRVNTAFTLLMFACVFAVQAGVGFALTFWPSVAGHSPAEAHRIVWGVLAALQGLAAVPYLFGEAPRPLRLPEETAVALATIEKRGAV